MVPQQKVHNSLQHRVDEYLRGRPTVYAVEEAGEEAVEEIFDMVQKAEVDLKAAQESVNCLKWELAKAQETLKSESSE